MKVSIEKYLPLLFAGFLLVSGTVVAIGIIYFSYNLEIKREIENKKTLLETVHTSLYTDDAGSDKELKSSVIKNIASSSNVAFFRIVNPSTGEVIFSGKNKIKTVDEENLPEFTKQLSVRNGIFQDEEVKEISIAGDSGEGLWMGVNLEEIKSTVLQETLLAVFSILLIIGVAYAAGFYMLRKYFIKPLHEIAEEARELGEGKYDLDLKSDYTVTEMNVLTSSLNESVKRIKKQREREKTLSKMKSEFISIAAHQLRTPLSAIKWTFQMLLEGDVGELTEEQREFIERGSRTNENMVTLINDLLNVSRIEEGRFGYEFEKHSLEKIVEEVIEEKRLKAQEEDVTLNFEKPQTSLPQVRVDPEKITLAIKNLIDNAVKYTFPGGQITVKLKLKNNAIEFSIADTGVGIPENQMQRLFTKFFRAENAIRLQTEGSGLGLYLVKNIIESHKGKVWAESEEGKGSTFYFTLPFEEEDMPNNVNPKRFGEGF